MAETITAQLNAYLPQYIAEYYKICLAANDQKEALDCLIFSVKTEFGDSIPAGTANIVMTPFEGDELRAAHIKSLREAKTKLQADTQLKLNEFDHKIQELLCLEAPHG